MAVPGTADQEEVGVPARSSLAQSVFDVLMAEIVRVERRPGEPLNKDEIAAQLGVSRQPVTDAINRLAAMGLATVIPQVNSYVSRISASDVVESSFVRSAVEAEVVHILARRPRPALVEKLRADLEEQIKVVAAVDYEGFHAADDVFHRHMAELAGLPGLPDQITAARLHLVRIRWLGLPRPGRLALAYAEHVKIVDEIEAGRPRRAAKAVAEHIRYSESELRRLQKDQPQYFL
jgi:GntR family transcriptional regulator, rspAB operon transcriptional repressor